MICKLAAFIDKISIAVNFERQPGCLRQRMAGEVSVAVVFSPKNLFSDEKSDGKKTFKNRQKNEPDERTKKAKVSRLIC